MDNNEVLAATTGAWSSFVAVQHSFKPMITPMNKAILVISAALIAAVAPSRAAAQSAESEQTYFDFQVEQPVKVKTSRPPVYPERLRSANIEGQVLVQYVVDESGVAQMSTFKVLKSTDTELSESVRRAVSATTFTPAEVRGHKVKQLVQQPFVFASHR